MSTTDKGLCAFVHVCARAYARVSMCLRAHVRLHAVSETPLPLPIGNRDGHYLWKQETTFLDPCREQGVLPNLEGKMSLLTENMPQSKNEKETK